MINSETRVRMGAKQTAKGGIQLDLTTEAPSVDEAGKLLGQAIVRLKAEVEENGLHIVGQENSG